MTNEIKLNSIGLQTYTIRSRLTDAASFDAAFAKVRAMGYDEIQLAPCGIGYDVIARIAESYGLRVISILGRFADFVKAPDKLVKAAEGFGTDDICIGYQPFPDPASAYDFIERANKLSKRFREGGCTLSYHHHSHEFLPLGNGTNAFEMLLDGLDENIRIVPDTYWLLNSGVDIHDTLLRLSGRVSILHLKDMAFSDGKPVFAAVGEGVIDWQSVIRTALGTGIRHFVTEQDDCCGKDPFDCAAAGAEYLRKNFMN